MVEALFAVALFAGQWDLEAAATAEARAGQAPVIAGRDARAFAAVMVRPVGAVRFDSTDLALRLDYGPRFFWQSPRPAVDTSGPLILHTANFTLTSQTERTVSISAQAGGSIGQPDYTALAASLGPSQGTLPVVNTMASGIGQVTTTVRLTPLTRLLVGGRLFRWQSLDVPEGVSPTLVTGQTVASFDPAVAMRVTHTDTIGLQGSIAGAWYSTGLTYLTVTPAISWERRLDPTETLRLTLGVTHSRRLDAAPSDTQSTSTLPVGSFAFESIMARRDGVTLRLTGETAATVVLDPVLQTTDTRGLVRGGATMIVSPDWMFVLRGDFSTSIRPSERIGMADVTVYSVTASARKLVTGNLVAELGALWADRGPRLDAPDFAFHQPQRWVYLMLTASTRAMGRWAQ